MLVMYVSANQRYVEALHFFLFSFQFKESTRNFKMFMKPSLIPLMIINEL